MLVLKHIRNWSFAVGKQLLRIKVGRVCDNPIPLLVGSHVPAFVILAEYVFGSDLFSLWALGGLGGLTVMLSVRGLWDRRRSLT
jgi:hypothetical protein